jgi:hypothetical protein
MRRLKILHLQSLQQVRFLYETRQLYFEGGSGHLLLAAKQVQDA